MLILTTIYIFIIKKQIISNKIGYVWCYLCLYCICIHFTLMLFSSSCQINPFKIPSVWTGPGQNCLIFTVWTGKSIDGEAPLLYSSNQIFHQFYTKDWNGWERESYIKHAVIRFSLLTRWTISFWSSDEYITVTNGFDRSSWIFLLVPSTTLMQ